MREIIQGLKVDILEPASRRSRTDPSLFFIHGAGMDGSIWKAQINHFARRYTTYCINLPGHGGSDGGGKEKISDYAQDVRSLLHGLMPSGPHLLVGHSMGGAIAIELAVQETPSVAGIVLLGTAARLRVMPIVFQTMTKDPDRFFRSIAYVAFARDTPNDVRERLIAATRSCPLPVIVRDLKACDAFDIGERLSAIRVPTLIICGAEDQLTPVNLARDLKAQIARSRLAAIPGAGHMVMVEAPGAVNQEIERFLAGLRRSEAELNGNDSGG